MPNQVEVRTIFGESSGFFKCEGCGVVYQAGCSDPHKLGCVAAQK